MARPRHFPRHHIQRPSHHKGTSPHSLISTDQQGYGIAELPGTEFTPDTLAYAGSCTKAHVTALLAVLVESGRYKDVQGRPLAWETPISALIPDFVLQDAWAAANVTLEDASCHRTGLAKHNNAYLRYLRLNGYDQPRKIISLREIVTQLRHLPMGSSPRSTFCYSNLMFAALSHVIETVTGEWLGDVLRTWLWEPLGMRDTYLSLDQALSSSKHVARGYYWDSTAEKYTAFERMPTEEVSGSGAVITTANDMAKWLQFWLCEEKPLTETGHRTLLRPNIRVDDGLNTGPFDVPLMYAKGWQTSAYRGHRFWTHHGSMDAFGAQVTFLPDLGLGVAALGNTAFTTSAVTELLTWYLVDWRLKVPQVERFDWLSKYVCSRVVIRTDLLGGTALLVKSERMSAVAGTSCIVTCRRGLRRSHGVNTLGFTTIQATSTWT